MPLDFRDCFSRLGAKEEREQERDKAGKREARGDGNRKGEDTGKEEAEPGGEGARVGAAKDDGLGVGAHPGLGPDPGEELGGIGKRLAAGNVLHVLHAGIGGGPAIAVAL